MINHEVAERFVEVSKQLAEMLELAFQAFRKPTEESVKDAEEGVNDVRRSSAELTKTLVARSLADEQQKDRLKPLLSMASNFDRTTYNIEGLVHQLKLMVKDQVSFSDRGVKEINDIFQKAMDFLDKVPDLILTQDKLSAQHIGEQVRSVLKIANGYSEDHEERLMQGICMPKSAPIYLGILESLKGIIVHTLEVDGTIVSLAPKS